jgi:hypothetical protein
VVKSRDSSFAFISNKDRTRRVSLYGNCFFDRDIAGYACILNRQLVAEFTGPVFNSAEDVTPDIGDISDSFKL